MIALALALLLAVADTTDTPPDPARQVITRAEIEAAGLFHLADLFALIDGSRTATVDGFTWRTSTAGRPFGAEPWTLLVDGARVDFALFGEQNLTLLPVAIAHVDSVEVWRGPRLVAGTMARGGVLHLHTQQARHGAAARAGVAVGNEVGDPGPYRYVPELATPNVDKFGADFEGLASLAGPGHRAQARFKLLRFYATDPAALGRNREALGRNPALRVFAPALRLEADALGGTHALHALGGGADDLWFFQPFGREIPVRRRWGHAALHGTLPVAPRLSVGYRLALAESRLDAWDGAALGLDPRWRERTARGGLDGAWRHGPWALGLGGEVRRTTADGADGFTLGTVSAQVARTTGRSLYGLDATLAFAGEAALSAALHARHTLGTRALGAWTLGATAALTQRLPEEAGRFGFWQARGYDAFDALFADQPAPPGRTTEASLGVDAAGRLAPGLTLEAGAAVRSVRGLLLDTQRAAPAPDLPLHAPRPPFIVPDAAGEVASGRLALRAGHGRWRGRLFYDGLALLHADADFERAWEALPRHRAGATATLAPDPGFTVTGTLTVRSAAYWPAYEALDGGNDGLYAAAVPALWRLDASVQKRLWQERLHLSLFFRNLLGQEERYHPVGAALDLRFYLRAELLLGR